MLYMLHNAQYIYSLRIAQNQNSYTTDSIHIIGRPAMRSFFFDMLTLILVFRSIKISIILLKKNHQY